MNGKIKWIKDKEGKKPGSVLFEGDQQFYTCWDIKGKQKGDRIIYNETKRGDYNGKTQITIEISDEVPAVDINADTLQGKAVSHKDFTNESIENQVLIKVVGQVFESLKGTEGHSTDWLEPITDAVIDCFKKIQNRNKAEDEPEIQDGFDASAEYDGTLERFLMEADKIIIASEQYHWYDKDGNPCYEVEYADKKRKGQFRPADKRDARKLSLRPSVTVINSILDKPSLNAWKLNQVLLCAATTPLKRSETDAEEWAKAVKTESEQQAKDAREKGIIKHAQIENFFKIRSLPDDETTVKQIHAINEILIKYEISGIDDIQPEKSFSSPLFGGFGGKMDLPAIEKGFVGDVKTTEFTLKDGVPWKNGKKAKLNWDEHLYQVCGYGAGNNLFREDTLINIYVSTIDDSVYIHEWSLEDKTRGFAVFRMLCELWHLINGF